MNQNTCRICITAKRDENLKNFNIQFEEYDNLKLGDIFHKVTAIKLEKPWLNQKICQQCFDELINCFKFITKCINSEETLKLLNSNFHISNIVIKTEENFVWEVEGQYDANSSTNDLIEKSGDYYKCLSCNKYFATESGVNKHVSQCISSSKTSISSSKKLDLLKPNDKTSECDKIENNLENEDSDNSVELPDPKNKRKSEFLCQYCNKVFDRSNRLKRHLSVHNPENKPFECKICKYRFASEKNLISHEFKHSEVGQTTSLQILQVNKCPNCPRKFLKKESLASHMRVHKEGFQTARLLQKNYKCNSCTKSFFKITSLIKHILEHDTESECICSFCKKEFPDKMELIKHLKWHNDHKLFQCEICKKGYNQIGKLNNHMKSHTEEKRFLCSECGRSFRDSSYLTQHMRRHTGEKPIQCTECPAKFTCRAGLSSHMLTHTKIKAFSCEICKSSFTKKHSLQKHMRIHTGEKPYECQTCFARFKSSYVLKRHMLTHTGEKPYSCQYCVRAFAQKNDLIKHLKTHLGDKIYQCNMCTESFRLHYELRDHLYEHYKKQKEENISSSIN